MFSKVKDGFSAISEIAGDLIALIFLSLHWIISLAFKGLQYIEDEDENRTPISLLKFFLTSKTFAANLLLKIKKILYKLK